MEQGWVRLKLIENSLECHLIVYVVMLSSAQFFFIIRYIQIHNDYNIYDLRAIQWEGVDLIRISFSSLPRLSLYELISDLKVLYVTWTPSA